MTQDVPFTDCQMPSYLKPTISFLGSCHGGDDSLALSAQHFLLLENLAARSTPQDPDCDHLGMLEEHWRLLNISRDYLAETTSEGRVFSTT